MVQDYLYEKYYMQVLILLETEEFDVAMFRNSLTQWKYFFKKINNKIVFS